MLQAETNSVRSFTHAHTTNMRFPGKRLPLEISCEILLSACQVRGMQSRVIQEFPFLLFTYFAMNVLRLSKTMIIICKNIFRGLLIATNATYP